MLADLLEGIEQRNLSHILNIVVVSDHGMASTDNSRLIYLDDIIDMSLIEHTDGWPLYGLRPFPNVNLTALHATLASEVAANVAKGDSHWNVYLRDVDMPARWHFSANERIAPLWIVPDAGWAVVTRKEFDAASGARYSPAGLHGYDNEDPLMRAIFVARGPAFSGVGTGRDSHDGEVGVVVEEFGNWEVYRILCEALGIREGPGGNNATIEGIRGMVVVAGEIGGDEVESEDEEEDEEVEVEDSIATTTPTTTPLSTDTPVAVHTLGVTDPVPTAPVTDITADEDGEANKEAMNWLEYAKWKAEALKEALDKWWEGVWTDGGR